MNKLFESRFFMESICKKCSVTVNSTGIQSWVWEFVVKQYYQPKVLQYLLTKENTLVC